MQKAAFEALQVKKDLMHRQIRKQVSAGCGLPPRPALWAFRGMKKGLQASPARGLPGTSLPSLSLMAPTQGVRRCRGSTVHASR